MARTDNIEDYILEEIKENVNKADEVVFIKGNKKTSLTSEKLLCLQELVNAGYKMVT